MAAAQDGIRNRGEEELGKLVASCYANPLKFVRMMYPWGEPGTFLAYETGPDVWQTAALEVIGEMVAKQEGIDKALRRALRLAVASGHGVGKALDNDTPIPTPDGFIRIGSMAKGDKVFGPTGAPCTVMGVFPQGVTDAYRVTFSDGASVIACPDHQWTVKGRQERRKGAGWVTLTTRQLLEYGVSRPNGAARALMWEIPGQGAAQFKAQSVPIDPYTLGAWLGDGSHDCGRVTNADQEVWGAIEATYGLGKPWPAGKAVTRTVLGIKPELARLGVLRHKHVPDAYKINDAETRLAVLQGLLDTDGECGQNGSVTFSSTDQRLVDDVIWLARSLGAVARLRPAVKKTGFRPCYRVTITAPKALRLFRIERKEARRHEPQERYLKRWVRSIEPVESRETTCIAVSDQSRQFLCGDEFIVTHNTAFVAWIIQWFASTRPYPQIVVTANTKTQLQTKTWRELSKWHSVSLNNHWFEWTATQFKLVEKPDLWFATAVPWSVSNAQAFAGTHEEHVLMVFDEASNIEDIIWETAEGAMTTEGAMWIALGNPVKNTGRFRECWTRFRDRWITFQVDARKAKKANQNEIKQWIEDYGIESDFVKTRILGEFPSASPMQMIPVDLVDAAVAREVKWEHIPASTPKLMGVDVARGGSAQSVICFRQGPKLLKDIFAYRIPDLMQLAAQVAKKINDYKPDVVFIDATGMGVGVYDRLVQLNFDNVVAVYTGDRKEVSEKRIYYNPRIEIWGRMKTWFRTADIPDHRALREDLIGPEYFFDQMQLMRLESKDDMQSRGIPSPDFADSLALTFSQAVPVKRVYGYDEEFSNEPEVV